MSRTRASAKLRTPRLPQASQHDSLPSGGPIRDAGRSRLCAGSVSYADGSGSNFASQDFFQNVSSVRDDCGVIWILRMPTRNRMAEMLGFRIAYSLRSEISKKIF